MARGSIERNPGNSRLFALPAGRRLSNFSLEIRGILMGQTLTLALVLLGAAIQRYKDRQRPGTHGEGELDQDRQDDPLVPPAIRGERVGRAYRVAMATLAVDLVAAMLVDGVVSGQEDGPF